MSNVEWMDWLWSAPKPTDGHSYRDFHVRFWHLADLRYETGDVGLEAQPGPRDPTAIGQLMTQNGHSQLAGSIV